MSVPDNMLPVDPIAELQAFRRELLACFHRRGDALFELTDAMLCAQGRVCSARVMFAGRRAPLPVVVRDELGELFADAEFAEAFGVRGKPGWSPGRLAMVTALQMVENLPDSQAAQAVRLRLDWKYCLGLDLTDEGFDPSVLSEFRGRVAGHGLEERALDLLVAALVERGC